MPYYRCDELSEAWGVERNDGGRSVWCELAVDDELSAGVAEQVGRPRLVATG